MPSAGSVCLRMGNIADPQNRQFLTDKVNLLFCNNYKHIMSICLEPKKICSCVDKCVAGLLTQLEPGAKLITLHPIQGLPLCLAKANELRKSRGLLPGDNVSFYQVGVFPSPEGQENFTHLRMTLWFMCTPAAGPASFLCNEANCYYNKQPIVAFNIRNEGSASELLLPLSDCPKHNKLQRMQSKAHPSLFASASEYLHHKLTQNKWLCDGISSYSYIHGALCQPYWDQSSSGCNAETGRRIVKTWTGAPQSEVL